MTTVQSGCKFMTVLGILKLFKFTKAKRNYCFLGILSCRSLAVKMWHQLDVRWNTLDNQVDPFKSPPHAFCSIFNIFNLALELMFFLCVLEL